MNKSSIYRTAIALSFMTVVWACDQSIQTAQTSAPQKKDLQAPFRYSGDSSILVSGHRGGIEEGFPENSREGFAHILGKMPAFFEIDPRLTKDSVIVLLHDATLERTTTGTGKLSDYTWEELQKVRLKDHEGNETPYLIPRLDSVIGWSRGKTIVNLDKKDVPMDMIAELIKKMDAEDHVMLTVHTGAQARYYYDRLPGVQFSAFCRTMKEYEDMKISGVPWNRMIAYVGPSINPENEKIVEMLHADGVRCMISVAPTHDKLATPEEREAAYLQEI
ncbi:MAG: glycerophosphodiester phosphodiesterase family protein, partial [Prolixibacteraceae bacterium]